MKDVRFKEIVERIQRLNPNIERGVPQKSMLGFYYNGKGLVWVSYPQGKKISVHLRKGDYASIDPEKRVKPNGWGGYPEYHLEEESEIDYLIELG